MKKKISFIFFAAMMILSASAVNGYKITGTAEGTVSGDTVYLCDMQGFFSMIPVETAVINKDGKFEFTGDFDGATNRFILPMHAGKPTATTVFVLENADIDMQIFADPKNKAIIKGGPAAQMLADYEKGSEVFSKQIEKPWKVVMDSTATKEAKQKAQALVDSLSALKDSYTKVFLVANIPSPASDYLYAANQRIFTDAENDVIMKKMDAGHHYYYYNLMLEEKKAQEATAVGKPYTDLCMPNPKGKNIKVSDYVKKNKYTLIDFWASWCGPCRAEMPTVLKAYSIYHKKGFEVVGVSFDNNKAAWIKAIKTLKLSWPHMSDLKGWECAAAPIYNIKGIPANVLVDKNGTIVAKNLRGEDLLNKMAELMK